MNSNKVVKDIHRSAVCKIADNIALTGNTQLAVEIGNAIIKYGQKWTAGLANDGRIDDDEIIGICSEFNALIDEHVPAVDNAAVGIVYNGISFLGIGWKGLKHYLSKWFGLSLSCIAICLTAGCQSFYENAGMRVRTGSITAPVEFSDPTSAMNIRCLFFMDGADVYAAKGSQVSVSYTSVNAGSWLTSATTQTCMVAVMPAEAVTNAVKFAAK